jgi:hypothetical protein
MGGIETESGDNLFVHTSPGIRILIDRACATIADIVDRG